MSPSGLHSSKTASNIVAHRWSWKDSTLQPSGLRKGITEVKYIEGLLNFWDGVRAAKPGAVVDGCSGGGRNIDLETISRGIWKWRSDFRECDASFFDVQCCVSLI